MAKHGGPRDSVKLPPSYLKSQAPAQVDKVPIGREKGEVAQSFDVSERLLAPLQSPSDLVKLVIARVFALDDVKLPLGRVEVGCVEYLPAEGVRWAEQVCFKPFVEPV